MEAITLELLIVVVLILLNGVLSMTEIAVVSSRKSRLQQMAREGVRGAATARALAAAPSRFLATVQVGITLVGVLAGAFGGATMARELERVLRLIPLLEPYAGGLAFALVVAAITYLSLVIGELVPKRVALANPEKVASLMAATVSRLARLASPAVWLLDRSTNLVVRFLNVREATAAPISEEEIRLLLGEGTASGVFERSESAMIESVLELDRLPVREIMTPRPKLIFLDVADPHEALWHKVVVSGHSQFPVYEENRDNIVGLVTLKAIYANLAAGLPVRLRDLATRPLVVPSSQRVLSLLETFRRTSTHVALVADEFGSIDGLVTLIDVMEAIAGDFPSQEERLKPGAVKRADGTWLVDGMVELDRLERVFPGLAFDPPEHRTYHTLAGFLLSRLEHIPTEGETHEEQAHRFEIIDMDRQRVDKVLVTPPGVSIPPAAPPAGA
ncbi:MAG: HlyC/CorC family transporter [Verrucomicrobiales bacterium]|nr:HlyC/CorC family transporter [Verrucomicrobiales bacterium]